MTQRPRITKDMIVEKAFAIVKDQGVERLTVRSISEGLGCSTQPVLYNFASIDEIKMTVYQMANEYHGQWLMNMERDYDNPMFAIGMNYIRFGVEEKNLFRFLFQTNEFSGEGMMDLIHSDELAPIMNVLQQEVGVSLETAREIFTMIFVHAHGYASLYANNDMVYEEEMLVNALDRVFEGAVYAVKEQG